jgi:sugar phosphate isomerase/epimerase
MIKIAAMVGAPDLTQKTLAVYQGDLEGAFAKLTKLGYDGVELMTKDPGKLDGEMIHRWLENMGLMLVGLCTGHVNGEDGLGLVEADPNTCKLAMERLKTFIDFAGAYFGAGTLVNIGRSRGSGLPNNAEETLNQMEIAFRELAEYANERGVVLVLEPINVHQVTYIHTTQEGIAMIDRVNHPNLRLMVDVYHMNIEDVNIYHSLRQAGERIKFVHFADNNRKWPGSAHLDFKRIVAVLKKIKYEGFVSLEILPWPDPDTAARCSIEYLRRFIPPSKSVNNNA